MIVAEVLLAGIAVTPVGALGGISDTLAWDDGADSPTEFIAVTT